MGAVVEPSAHGAQSRLLYAQVLASDECLVQLRELYFPPLKHIGKSTSKASAKNRNIMEGGEPDGSLETIKMNIPEIGREGEDGGQEPEHLENEEMDAGSSPRLSDEAMESSTNGKPGDRGADDDDRDKERPVNGVFVQANIRDYMMTASSEFTSAQLYEIYQMKLQRDSKEAGAPKKGQASRMVRTFVDFASSVEERLKKLEEKMDVSQNEEDVAPNKSGQSEHEKVEVRFYNLANQPKKSQDSSKTVESWKSKGTFESEADTKHCIRVLFHWNVNNGPEAAAKTSEEALSKAPDPEAIEIEEIRIHSKPITEFLASQADYEMHKDNTIHFRKPFRFLLTNAKAIRAQATKLQAKFGLVPGVIYLSTVIQVC